MAQLRVKQVGIGGTHPPPYGSEPIGERKITATLYRRPGRDEIFVAVHNMQDVPDTEASGTPPLPVDAVAYAILKGVVVPVLMTEDEKKVNDKARAVARVAERHGVTSAEFKIL
jgi:hypothetical protein